jgi:NAD(P)H-hydrate epimerase
MASAGTGDVLTGIITALVAQQLSIFDAARLGTWIHGAAGDVARIECGEYSLTASQVINSLSIPFMRCVTISNT